MQLSSFLSLLSSFFLFCCIFQVSFSYLFNIFFSCSVANQLLYWSLFHLFIFPIPFFSLSRVFCTFINFFSSSLYLFIPFVLNRSTSALFRSTYSVLHRPLPHRRYTKTITINILFSHNSFFSFLLLTILYIFSSSLAFLFLFMSDHSFFCLETCHFLTCFWYSNIFDISLFTVCTFHSVSQSSAGFPFSSPFILFFLQAFTKRVGSLCVPTVSFFIIFASTFSLLSIYGYHLL